MALGFRRPRLILHLPSSPLPPTLIHSLRCLLLLLRLVLCGPVTINNLRLADPCDIFRPDGVAIKIHFAPFAVPRSVLDLPQEVVTILSRTLG